MSRPTHKPSVLEYVACYGLYVLFLALTALAFVIFQSTAHLIVDLLVEDIFVNRFVYMTVMVVLGLATLILAVSAEHYLHNGVKRQRLLKRFARLSVPLVALSVVFLAVRQLLFIFALG